MPNTQKPLQKPVNACFSSGPCAKRPGWNLNSLQNAAFGRSHRAKIGKEKLQEVIDLSRKILGIPADYRIGIVPASDTGAIEMALWNFIGARPVDVFHWESFGSTWAADISKQLKIKDVNSYKSGYGTLPDLTKANPAHDIVFTWNGTTSGVKLANADWISDNREGITICDATSAAFAMDLPWKKLDVTTWSWQKVLGGEAAHGMIVLSPKAVARLEAYTPAWPIPKIFTIKKDNKIIEGIFAAETINTPSMLCVEDAIDGLRWAESVGGLQGLIKRSEANLGAVSEWVKKSKWAGFLAESDEINSNTSICLKIIDSNYLALSKEEQERVAKEIVSLLAKEKVAYDIASYRDAPTGIRIWGGATVETSDIKILLEWLDWAYSEVSNVAKAA